MPHPTLDHLVIDVRDQMDHAQRVFQALGFHLTARGHHTLGSCNHLAVFDTHYLELLGFGSDDGARPELASFPIGLNGLVFRSGNAAETAALANANGLPLALAQSFSRPVLLDGQRHDAAFRTTRFPPDYSGIGRFYFCEHLTPELVWRPEWQSHPNGAVRITGILIATDDTDRLCRLFMNLFGPDGTFQKQGTALVLPLQHQIRLELRTVQEVKAMLGDAAPDPAGRSSFMAAIRLATAFPELSGRPHNADRIVPAAQAFNTALLFEAATDAQQD